MCYVGALCTVPWVAIRVHICLIFKIKQKLCHMQKLSYSTKKQTTALLLSKKICTLHY
jgi:hypothetical protein